MPSAGAEDFRSLPNRVVGMGLDNDGDMLYDTAPPAPYSPDPDCAVTVTGACCAAGLCAEVPASSCTSTVCTNA